MPKLTWIFVKGCFFYYYFGTFWPGESKCTEICSEKFPDLSIWLTLEPNPIPLLQQTTARSLWDKWEFSRLLKHNLMICLIIVGFSQSITFISYLICARILSGEFCWEVFQQVNSPPESFIAKHIEISWYYYDFRKDLVAQFIFSSTNERVGISFFLTIRPYLQLIFIDTHPTFDSMNY